MSKCNNSPKGIQGSLGQTLHEFAMTNLRKFNDSPQTQRNVAILTNHRNFPATLTNLRRLPHFICTEGLGSLD